MKRLIILIVVLIKINQVCGENPCGIMTPQNSGQWGVGFIWFSLNSKVTIYNKPNGDKVGTLTRGEYGRLVFDKLNLQGDKEVNQNDFVWAGHLWVTLLKVYRVESDFLNVFNQSENSGLWINLKEYDKQIQFLTYRTLMLNPEKGPSELKDLVKTAAIGVNLTQTCLNLRNENHINSEIIKCIPNNEQLQARHTHLKIIEIKGDWVKVEARSYAYDSKNDESGEGCSFRQIGKETGWIKAVDENGFPNIWYSVTAY